jgi:hypothetical protein
MEAVVGISSESSLGGKDIALLSKSTQNEILEFVGILCWRCKVWWELCNRDHPSFVGIKLYVSERKVAYQEETSYPWRSRSL